MRTFRSLLTGLGIAGLLVGTLNLAGCGATMPTATTKIMLQQLTVPKLNIICMRSEKWELRQVFCSSVAEAALARRPPPGGAGGS